MQQAHMQEKNVFAYMNVMEKKRELFMFISSPSHLFPLFQEREM